MPPSPACTSDEAKTQRKDLLHLTTLATTDTTSWTENVLQSFVNAENVSFAHLLYEQRLLDQTPSLPNIGGQSFIVTDPNPAISFGDIYLLLPMLAKTPVTFPHISPAPLLLLSYLIEWYVVIQYRYLPSLPKVSGDLVQIQPSLFSVSTVHTIADDTRARKSPQEGGLGYRAPVTTLDGMCRQVYEWNSRVEKGQDAKVEGKPAVSVSEEGIDANLAVPPQKM